MKKIFFLIIIFWVVYNIITCLNGLYSLANLDKQKDILVYTKFAYTYGTKEAWMDYGAEEVETDQESGDRYINFDGYITYYQAYDKREDILGTVIEKKTGREKLYIRINLGNELYMHSSELNKNKFFLFNVPDDVYGHVEYIDGEAVSMEGIPYDKEVIENACEQLIKSVDDFEETAEKVYEETYQAQRTEQTHKLARYIFLIFGCLAVWRVGDPHSFGHIGTRKKKNQASR